MMYFLFGLGIGMAGMFALIWDTHESQMRDLRAELEKERSAHRALWLWCNRNCSKDSVL